MIIDPFREIAAAMRSRQGFPGTNLKFVKDAGWIAGKDAEDFNDAELLALANDTMLGFVLWQGGKPVDYHIGFVRDRYQPPRRDQLGHTDRSRWRNGKEDPFQFTFALPLFDLNNSTLLTFSTTSQGGKDCIANLLDAYSDNKERHADEARKLPLVTLGRDAYQHASYGKVAVPLLDINKWVEPPPNLKPIMPPAPANALLLDQPAGDGKLIEHRHSENPADETDDFIPF